MSELLLGGVGRHRQSSYIRIRALPSYPTQLKQTALLLAFTLGEDCFRFNTQPLIDTIRSLRDRYHAAQLRSLETLCSQILEHDVYQPISIQSDKEYRTLVCPYGLDRQDSSPSSSSSVPGYEPLLLEEYEPVRVLSPAVKGKKVGDRRRSA